LKYFLFNFLHFRISFVVVFIIIIIIAKQQVFILVSDCVCVCVCVSMPVSDMATHFPTLSPNNRQLFTLRCDALFDSLCWPEELMFIHVFKSTPV